MEAFWEDFSGNQWEWPRGFMHVDSRIEKGWLTQSLEVNRDFIRSRWEQHTVRLKLSEIQFDAGSVVDPAGFVFHHDGRVFRAISALSADLYRELLTADFISDLFAAGLVETWIADVELEGFGLVVEHRRIPVLSCWTEWCSSMIRDATAMVCRLNLEMAKHGLVTKDVQPGNVQFVDGRPIWIDFGSVVPSNSHGTFRFDEFRYHSLLPLWLFSKGRFGLGRAIYGELGAGYLKRFSMRRPFRWIPPGYTFIKRRASHIGMVAALEKTLDFIEGLSIAPRRSNWTKYGQGGMPAVDDPQGFSQKAQAVYGLLRRLAPGSLLDAAGNKGWYAELGASMGYSAVSFDTDDASVCDLYQRVRDQRLPILPLLLDFLYPTPPYSIGLGKASALERLRSDVTLVLALVHHLVFEQGVHFEPIARLISEYTRKNAIVEFPPKEDRYVKEWIRPTHHWYTLDNFVASLRRYFPSIEIHESWPPPRKLVLCSK
jgi:hypothetical protein